VASLRAELHVLQKGGGDSVDIGLPHSSYGTSLVTRRVALYFPRSGLSRGTDFLRRETEKAASGHIFSKIRAIRNNLTPYVYVFLSKGKTAFRREEIDKSHKINHNNHTISCSHKLNY